LSAARFAPSTAFHAVPLPRFAGEDSRDFVLPCEAGEVAAKPTEGAAASLIDKTKGANP
jgi:hypothetical protein